MSESPAHAAIEAIARNSYGRLIAYIAARSSDVAGAEDALSDAIAAALQRWPTDGVPQKPEAWLLHAAGNRAIDAARRHQVGKTRKRFSGKSPRKRRPWQRLTNNFLMND